MFSIIIPTYNCVDLVGQALDSIFQQSFSDFEIVVMDGNSTDGTKELVLKYSKEHNNIVFHSEPDKGIYDAMNKGVKVAQGDWLYFLGADDYLANKDVLLTVSKSVNSGNCNFIYGNVISTKLDESYNSSYDEFKMLKQNICHQAIFYHKSLLSGTTIYDMRFKACADWDLNLKLFCSKGIKSKYIDSNIAYFTDNGFSSDFYDIKFIEQKDYKYLVYKWPSFNIKPEIFDEALRSNISKKKKFQLFMLYPKFILKKNIIKSILN